MTKDRLKRCISLAVFGLGILGGLWGCLAYAGSMFVVGENDSPQEVWALTFALATPLPACILALWQRVLAGSWLIFAGLSWPYGLLAQRAYMIKVRHFPNQPTILQTLRSSLLFTSVLVGIGLFAVVTGILRWPEIFAISSGSSDRGT